MCERNPCFKSQNVKGGAAEQERESKEIERRQGQFHKKQQGWQNKRSISLYLYIFLSLFYGFYSSPTMLFPPTKVKVDDSSTGRVRYGLTLGVGVDAITPTNIPTQEAKIDSDVYRHYSNNNNNQQDQVYVNQIDIEMQSKSESGQKMHTRKCTKSCKRYI